MSRYTRLTSHEEHGQTLIQVAVSMVVLLAFIGLAIDVGHSYAERRRMQNAADAGALAGAWELCFGTPANALTTAESYATDNLAEGADANYVDGNNWQISVVATETVETFISGIIGISTVDVAAEAVAACGGARNLCGIFPLTFAQQRWDDIPCDERFYVWNDDRLEETEPFCYADADTPLTICEACDCEHPVGPPDGASYILGSGSRGWVNLPEPQEPYSDPGGCTSGSCGNQVSCVIQNGYGGSLSIPGAGDPPLCLPSKEGVNTSSLHAVDEFIRDHPNQEVNVLLWDQACAPGAEPPPNTCEPGGANRYYSISGTACIVPLAVLDPPDQLTIMLKPEYAAIQSCRTASHNATWCAKASAIEAKRSCDCESNCGSTTGGEPQDGEVRSVSLIR